jgi:hypothetical protein
LLEHVHAARAGDWFLLFSAAATLPFAFAPVGSPTSPARLSGLSESLAPVWRALVAEQELLARGPGAVRTMPAGTPAEEFDDADSRQIRGRGVRRALAITGSSRGN